MTMATSEVLAPTPPQALEANKHDLKKMKEAAEGFEAYFVYMLLKEMRKSVPQGGLMGSGPGHEIYQTLFDDAISRDMAKGEGIGLSKMLVESYKKSNENFSQTKGLRPLNR